MTKYLIFTFALGVLFIGLFFLYRHIYILPLSYWGYAIEGFPLTKEQIERTEGKAGQRGQFIEFYLQWPSPDLILPTPFSTVTLQNIWDHGSVPCLTWEPFYINPMEKTVLYREILHGLYDPYLFKAAQEIKKWPHPLIIRLAHEMNLQRYHWGVEKEDYGESAPEIYVQLFRYIVDFFRAHNVQNVLWAFCANVESIPKEKWNEAGLYYPGDHYVDILGMDGYNWGTTQTEDRNHWKSEWRSFSDIFSPLYKKLKILSPEKPIFIFETASAKEGGNREKWVQDALKVSSDWRIFCVIWFYVNKEVDWEIRHLKIGDAIEKKSAQAWIEEFNRNRAQ